MRSRASLRARHDRAQEQPDPSGIASPTPSNAECRHPGTCRASASRAGLASWPRRLALRPPRETSAISWPARAASTCRIYMRGGSAADLEQRLADLPEARDLHRLHQLGEHVAPAPRHLLEARSAAAASAAWRAWNARRLVELRALLGARSSAHQRRPGASASSARRVLERVDADDRQLARVLARLVAAGSPPGCVPRW